VTAKISIFERLRRSFLGGAPVGLQSDMQPPAIRREASGATRVQPAEAVALTASAEPAPEWPIADALPAPDETPERHPTDAVDPSGTDHIVAAAAEAAYAAHPGANPKTVAQMSQMLAAAQAALVSWTNAQTPGNQAAVSAALAALVAYEASAKAG